MSQSNDRHLNYLNDRILNTQQTMLKIEQDWLKSINAPVKRLPKHVAEAVATRMFITMLPLEDARKGGEYIQFRRIIDSQF